MKQTFLAVAITAALAVPFAAHAEGAYIGANVGHVNQKASVDDLGSETESKTGYKLYGGFDFSKNFGVEGGYVDFGKSSGSGTDGVDTFSYSLKPTGVYVAVTGTLPLSEQFSLFGKVGASFNHTKARVTLNADSASGSDNRTSTLIGIGAAYNFNKNLALVAEYEDFGKVIKDDDASLKVNMFSIGLRYHF
jgi:OOP family OmpA-OmpF porin